MARTLKLDIQETQAELKTLLAQQKTARARERLQALYLLKLGKAKTVTDLANTLGRHRVTLQKWLKVYRDGGIDRLLADKRRGGKESKVPSWAIEVLQDHLEQTNNGFKSYKDIQYWFYDSLGIEVSYRIVYGLVHHKLKVNLSVTQSSNPATLQHSVRLPIAPKN